MTDPLPAAERARLQAIADLDLFDGAAGEALQDLTEQVARRLDLPIAAVSIVADGAQIFPASVGLGGWIEAAGGTPVEWAFCRNAVASRQPFVVEDAARHPLVKDNPLVTEDGIACYLGVPLITRDGHAIGTLCTIGTEPRVLSDEDVAVVREYAEAAMARIEQLAGR